MPRSWRPIYPKSGTPCRGVRTTGRHTGRSDHIFTRSESMLNRILASAATLGLFALPLAAQAPHATEGNEVTLTGQVIDTYCNTTMGASGAAHKACAQACANAGEALAILAEDGTIYMP